MKAATIIFCNLLLVLTALNSAAPAHHDRSLLPYKIIIEITPTSDHQYQKDEQEPLKFHEKRFRHGGRMRRRVGRIW